MERFRRADAVVLGLPRGGVPVAFAVARALGAPLDVIVVRKLGLPSQPELAMGAIGEGGVRIVDRALVRRALVSDEELAAVEARERAELDRRARHLRGDRAPVPLAGRTPIVVDDGVATGSTARAACQVANRLVRSRHGRPWPTCREAEHPRTGAALPRSLTHSHVRRHRHDEGRHGRVVHDADCVTAEHHPAQPRPMAGSQDDQCRGAVQERDQAVPHADGVVDHLAPGGDPLVPGPCRE